MQIFQHQRQRDRHDQCPEILKRCDAANVATLQMALLIERAIGDGGHAEHVDDDRQEVDRRRAGIYRQHLRQHG
ncbi:hypothetical protein D9M70_546280 [compost metagenome]